LIRVKESPGATVQSEGRTSAGWAHRGV